MSVIKISEDDYLKLVADGRQNDKVLYIVSSDILNMRNERIINVAEPSISSDAATKYYVDSSISSFTPQTYSAGYGLNLNNHQFSIDTSKVAEVNDLTAYETKADLTANYYKKNQTSSNVELNNKFNTLSTYSQIKN